MNNVEYTKKELAVLGITPETENGMYDHIIGMVEKFNKENHSGFSGNYALNVLNKVLRYEPVTPLTGAEEEWKETFAGSGIFQNMRCFHVFRENGKAYDTAGRVFVKPNGLAYGSSESRVEVTFPYEPEAVYINVDEHGRRIDLTKEELLELYSTLWLNAIQPMAETLLSLGSCGNERITICPEDYWAPMRVWVSDYASIEFHPYFNGVKKLRNSKEFSAQDLAECLPIVEDAINEMKAEIERLSSATVDFSNLPAIREITNQKE